MHEVVEERSTVEVSSVDADRVAELFSPRCSADAQRVEIRIDALHHSLQV